MIHVRVYILWSLLLEGMSGANLAVGTMRFIMISLRFEQIDTAYQTDEVTTHVNNLKWARRPDDLMASQTHILDDPIIVQ